MREVYGTFFWVMTFILIVGGSMLDDTDRWLAPYYFGLAGLFAICTTALTFRRR